MPAAAPTKGWSIAFWTVQVLLAFLFGMAGFMKTTLPYVKLAKQVPWSAVVGETLTRFIGICELAGSVGLILPALTRIRPILTAAVGAGLALIMLLASGYHIIHGEFQVVPLNFVLGGLAAFVAWGRFRKAPISPRN